LYLFGAASRRQACTPVQRLRDLGWSFQNRGFSVGEERSVNAVDVRIGQRVRARRLEIGMSQERLAEILGITFQQVQKYEKGVNRIAGSRLWDISKALDMPVSRFFEGLDAKKSAKAQAPDEVGNLLATPEGAQLVSLFSSIKSRAVRRRVVELVRALAEGESAR
jgi:transcriptional regulator with XRE-family HTH domain